MFVAYHASVLTLSSKYLGLALMLCFIVVIYSKMYQFNKFMKIYHKMALDYKKN
jgi:hypothetical protein